jgi:hypothetical protein
MFCPQCGEEIPDQSKFCPECGETIAVPSLEGEQPLSADEIQQISYIFIGSSAVWGSLAIMNLFLYNSTMYFLLEGLLAAAIYVLCYQKFREGDNVLAKNASLGLGISSGILSILAISRADHFFLVISVVTIALLYSFSKL